MKLYWKVQTVPTGPYRAFQVRGWPHASFDRAQEKPAVALYCEDDYEPWRVREGKHKLIKIRVAVPNDHSWHWRTLTLRAKTLQEAKDLALRFFKEHPEYVR